MTVVPAKAKADIKRTRVQSQSLSLCDCIKKKCTIIRLCNVNKLDGLGLICSGWCWLILYHHPTTTTTTKVPTSSIIGFVCIRDGIELLDVLRLQYYGPQNRRRSPRRASYILGPSEPGAGGRTLDQPQQKGSQSCTSQTLAV